MDVFDSQLVAFCLCLHYCHGLMQCVMKCDRDICKHPNFEAGENSNFAASTLLPACFICAIHPYTNQNVSV
jgi:hypothetical protein